MGAIYHGNSSYCPRILSANLFSKGHLSNACGTDLCLRTSLCSLHLLSMDSRAVDDETIDRLCFYPKWYAVFRTAYSILATQSKSQNICLAFYNLISIELAFVRKKSNRHLPCEIERCLFDFAFNPIHDVSKFDNFALPS